MWKEKNWGLVMSGLFRANAPRAPVCIIPQSLFAPYRLSGNLIFAFGEV
jgi:hypothetical protein